MDQIGSLVNTKLKIIPSEKLISFLKTIPTEKPVPINVSNLTGIKYKEILDHSVSKSKIFFELNNEDNELIKKISNLIRKDESQPQHFPKTSMNGVEGDSITDFDNVTNTSKLSNKYLETEDLKWLYIYMQTERKSGKKDIPFLYELLEESDINLPENQIIKRNPDLEARCVKLRSQQEARDYRKMTKTVDNVRMRFPEDSISYQLKHMNRQLIAVGQFIISIFAGFLFGFRGVEWIVGNLDFGFRLLLGVICALVIALAEIYFLAKKLNEEYSMPETVQLGGPNIFANQVNVNGPNNENKIPKEHVD